MTPEETLKSGGARIERFRPPGVEIKGRFPLVWFDEVQPALETVDFVEDVLADGALSVVYGESNCGKTFFAFDLALHVALGRPWRDKAVDAGTVVYVAAEGGFGARNRLAAFRQHHRIAGRIPFALLGASLDLLDPDADTGPLIEQLTGLAESPVRLIVLDTLSRVIAGGNENASEDMGALVRNADRIRSETGAHVMFVHHSGKDRAAGARGHSLLRAATDTEIEVTRDKGLGLSCAKVTKQRDMETKGEFAFSLEAVTVGQNTRGKPVTSCVVLASDQSVNPKPKPSQKEHRAIDVLNNVLAERGVRQPQNPNVPNVTLCKRNDFREALKVASVTDASSQATERTQWKRIWDALDNKGYIRGHGDWMWKA
ncbi:helicase RepA family protein [Rhodospirillum sp. A1_3_36]|uniref:helicase RepA family protein n=1 Tax=Rhodospirillum sp. A1_3_36 TaxID=3391666 RepID=UPI0039A43C0A